MHLLLGILLQTLPAQNFPPVDHPGVDPALHTQVLGICPARDADRGALLKHEARLADSVRTRDADTDLWFHLACMRALLGDANAISHEGPLLPAGAGWDRGAINVLLKVLSARPDDAKAAELLALLSLDDADADGLDRIAAAMRRAVNGGVTSAPVLRACTDFLLVQGDTAGSGDCARQALAAGRDSTWQLLRLARQSFQRADTETGARLFLSAAGAAHDSLAHLEVTWHLQWLLTPEEQRQWLDIPDSLRERWVRDRLAGRDVRDAQPPGARLAEHFNRLNYVERNFRLQVPRRLAAELRSGPATEEFPALCPDAASCVEPGGVWARKWREYRRWQTDFDDRGVVWMRFGRPDRRIPWECPNQRCPIDRESWIYDIDGRHMLLNFENEAFDGSVQPTRLVTGVLGSYFCDIDGERCRLSMLSQADAFSHHTKSAAIPATALVKPEAIEAIRREDLEAISAATTSDDNSLRGQKLIRLVSRLHRLWDPASGAPVALVTYSIPARDLKVERTPAAIAANVELQLFQWDPTTGRRADTTMSERFTAQGDSSTAEFVGFLLQPSAPGVTAWNLVATQADHRRGRAFEDPSAPLASGSIELSDLVIGAASERLRWNTGGNSILLAPLNAVNRDEPVHLYYQVKGANAETVQTTLALYRSADSGAATKPALALASQTPLRLGINETSPVLDVSRLSKGSYRLEVQLVNAAGKLVVRRATTIYLR